MNAPYLFEPDTDITLCNVPWDSEYHDVPGWTSQAMKDTYFNDLYQAGVVYRFTDSTYCHPGRPIVIDLPYSLAYRYNYCVVTNPPQMPPEDGEGYTFYYFITECEYVNPASSMVRLQLDVWTTFYHGQLLFGHGFLEQGHIGMANRPVVIPPADGTFPALSHYLSQPEDIDTGDIFYTSKVDTYSLQKSLDGSVLYPDLVMIVSTADLSKSFGTIDSPSLNTASGRVVDGVYSGCNVYFTNTTCLNSFLSVLSDYSWVAQCIISITCVPYALTRELILIDSDFNGNPTTGEDDDYFKVPAYYQPSTAWDFDIPGTCLIRKADIVSGFARPDIADIQKLWMYPFTCVELTTLDGNSLILRPQDLYLDDTPVVGTACVMPPFTTACMYPRYYARSEGSPSSASVGYMNANASTMSYLMPTGDFTDSAVWIKDFPQFSIVNNSYITYMASTANIRAWSYENAAWSQASGMAQAATSYDLQRAALGVSQANFEVDQQNQRMNLAINTGANGANALIDTITTGLSGNLVGAASTALHAAVTETANVWTSMNNFDTQRQIQANNIGLGLMQSDANLSLAKFVNSGNYANSVRGIQAGYRDAQLRPPSVAGQMGGEGFRYARGMLFSLAIRVKHVSADAQIRAAQYFRRFGYRVNRFVELPADLSICQHYTYYKMSDVSLVEYASHIPEDFKDALRGILSRGTTVWASPHEIGEADMYIWENTVRQDKVADYFD